MALFKILRGESSSFTTDLQSINVYPEFHDGYCYFTADTGLFYIDYDDGSETIYNQFSGADVGYSLTEGKAYYLFDGNDYSLYEGNYNLLIEYGDPDVMPYFYYKTDGKRRIPLNAKQAEEFLGYSIETVLNDSEVEIPTSSAVFQALKKDWNQNDKTATDYIWNRTHYKEILEETEIFDRSWIYEEEKERYNLNLDVCPFTMDDVGKSYKISYCETDYITSLEWLGEEDSENPEFQLYVPNPYISLQFYPTYSEIYVDPYDPVVNTYELRVAEIIEEVHPLDYKYVTAITEINKGLEQKIWRGLKEEYDAIEEKDDNTLYIVTDEFEVIESTFMSKDIYDIKNREEDIFEYADNTYKTPKSGVILTDTVNGFNYAIQMVNGNLISKLCIKSLEVIQMPNKTSYIQYEKFDPTGMSVRVTYEDGTVIDNFTQYQYNQGVDKTAFSIYYDQVSIIEDIIQLEVEPFNPEEVLIDFFYVDNFDGTYTITSWKGTLNGETSDTMKVPDFTNVILQ